MVIIKIFYHFFIIPFIYYETRTKNSKNVPRKVINNDNIKLKLQKLLNYCNNNNIPDTHIHVFNTMSLKTDVL